MPPTIEELAEMDDEELYEVLGQELLGPSRGFGGQDIDRMITFARRWLDQHWIEIRVKICGEDAIEILKERPVLDAISDAAVIADFVAQAYGRPAATVIAVIICRRGLQALCGSTP